MGQDVLSQGVIAVDAMWMPDSAIWRLAWLKRLSGGGAKPAMDSFTIRSTSNTYTTVSPASYSPGGTLTATVKSASDPDNPTRYVNGYFAFNTPELAFGSMYKFTADVTVLDSLIGSDAIGIASVGVGSTEVKSAVVNGKISIVFEFKQKSGSSDKFLEFHCGGKSMEMRNIRIWNVEA